MRTPLLLVLCIMGAKATAQSVLPDPFPGPATSAHHYYENHGQIIDELGDPWPSILYYSEKGRARLFFANDKVHHTVRIPGDSVNGGLAPDTLLRLDVRFDCYTENDRLCGDMATYESSQDTLNYFLPHCGSTGITGVYGWKTVAYENAFPGIDVRYTSNVAGPVMYFVVHPYADPSHIRLVLAGQDSLTVLTNGSLDAWLNEESVIFPRGSVYEVDAYNNTNIITGWLPDWTLQNDSTVGVTVGTYNPSKTLVIKIGWPVLMTAALGEQWGTYYDEVNISEGSKIAVETSYTGAGTPPDADVALYSLQDQQGNDFQAYNGLYTLNRGARDFYISKFNGGYVRQWATYYGGNGNEYGRGIALKSDLSDNFYVIGQSASTNLLIPSPNNGSYYSGSGPGILGEFKKTNGHPAWITKIPGVGTEITAMDIDNADGRLYFVGYTSDGGGSCSAPTGSLYPLCTPGTGRYYQTNAANGIKGFVTELNTSTNGIVWSTFFGASVYPRAVRKYNSGTVKKLYVGGGTDNTIYQLSQTTPPLYDAPGSTALPLANPSGSADYFQSTFTAVNNQALDGFISAFDGNFALEWFSYFGGNRRDIINSITVLPGGDIAVAGSTYTAAGSLSSTTANTTGEFPLYDNPATNDYFQGTHASFAANLPSELSDDFIARFNANHELTWSTYFGDAGQQGIAFQIIASNDYTPVIASDAAGNIFLAGTSEKPDNTTNTYLPHLPVLSLSGLYYQPTNASVSEALRGVDAYFAYFGPDNARKWTTYFGGSGQNQTINFPSRATEYLKDMAVLSGQRIYAILNTYGQNTPYECPQAGPTGPPYCDNTYAGGGDVFLGSFEYQPHLTGVGEKTSRTDVFSLRAYPNPAQNRVTVHFLSQKKSTVQVSVVDAVGKPVIMRDLPCAQGGNQFALDLQGLSSGLYTVQISNSEGHGAIKIVKQ